MATRTLTSGVPTLVLNPNAQRRRLVIQVLSTNIVAGNTGRVHLGYDFQPQTAAGNPAGGDILTQGAFVDKNEGVGTLAPTRILRRPDRRRTVRTGEAGRVHGG